MSLRKRCTCTTRCQHVWYYDVRVNGRRYRACTETSDKHRARDIESTERTRILEGKHGIRRQPDITFREFAKTYLRDHAEVHKRSVHRDQEIIKVFSQVFGGVLLHEITRHRIEQYKRERLQGHWSAYRQRRDASKPIQPATVNRELDTLRSIFSKAVEWGILIESPARLVKRLRVENQRTRILSLDEQRRLLRACRPQLQAIVAFALITSARISEILTLRWEQIDGDAITFLRTKNDKARRIPLGVTLTEVFKEQSRKSAWVFPNPRTRRPYTTVLKSFKRALERASIGTKDVTLHTLRHTALSRMLDQGYDDYTVMAISGHSSTRMLARYAHPTETRKIEALDSFTLVTNWSQGRSECKKTLVDRMGLEPTTSALRR